MFYKRIVILANSRKHLGRCLAGREILGQQYGAAWVRPVSDRPGAEVSQHERQYDDGSDPKIFDIVDVPLLKAKSEGCHTENWLLSPVDYWIKRGEITWDHAYTLAERPVKLWNSGSSTYSGNNDQLSQAAAAGFSTSIVMVYVSSVEIHVLTPGANFGNAKRRVQARFAYLGVNYWLWVTDPAKELEYLSQDAEIHELGPSLLTVSLAEATEVKGVFYHFKLIAAIMER